MNKLVGYLVLVAIAALMSPMAALAQQEFIRSENIVADAPTTGILTETTRVDGAGIFENGVTYVYSAEKAIRTGDTQASRVSKVQYDPESV